MNEIDDYTLKSWCTKDITEPDEQWYIFKHFKKDSNFKPYSFEKQNEIIEKKKQYIWKFIPETELIKNEDGSYYIKQKYIEWKLLKFVDIKQLDKKVLSDLLELFEWYIAFCKNEWAVIDVIWYQHDIHNLENIRKRRFLFYSRMFSSFLTSTNIIISSDSKVYMIDVCDTIPTKKRDQIQNKIKNAIKNAIIELWIKRTQFKIRRIIEKKQSELIDVLS